MSLRLSFLILFLFTSLFSAAVEPKRDPNYTGPSAPAEILPNMELPVTRPFAHPGIIHNQSDLDFVRARLAAKEEPWTSALAAMRASEYCKLNYKPKIIPVINPLANSVGYLMKDATAAYGHALLWCLTGERAHADKAIEILDASGTQLKEIQIGGSDSGKLMAGFTGGKFVCAAELMAYYRGPGGVTAGWPQASADRFRTMLLTVFYPRIENFQPWFNGNWDACMIATMMSIGVFSDDHAKFNRGLAYYLNGKGNGAITRYVYAHGENQESGRDQIHGQMGIGSLAAACEIAKKQGIDLYGAANNRLAAGYEHMATYLSGHDVKIVGPVPVSPKGRDRFLPIFELAYQHYVIEKKMDLPFLREVVEKHRPEGVDLIVFQSWGTLVNYRGPAIKPSISR
jgi:hypothetical protein